TNSRVTDARRAGDLWELALDAAPPKTVRAATVVNAAGAWADEVGALFGAAPQGLRPLRRTAALVTLAEPMPPEHPMVDDAAEDWYYRPDAAGAMISLGEAEPSEPCDAQPHEGAVAGLIATIERETSLRATGYVLARGAGRVRLPDEFGTRQGRRGTGAAR
ncbi:FAD-dependent oxidoreductase, partial [Streptomyces sp. tea 10]|nr:FAD-dependent oxidoreductase [Streptomyces sp. tea 10]